MSDSPNLAMLQQMFPGQVVLNVDEIASLRIWGKRHIYNLSSAKKLPFKRLAVGDLKVTLVEMARYLDSQQTGEVSHVELPEKRKPGRPRGSKSQQLGVALFQSELKLALLKAEAIQICQELPIIAAGIDGLNAEGAFIAEAHVKALAARLLGAIGSLPRLQSLDGNPSANEPDRHQE